MSYARWSSDDFRSDVYVYEHVNGGWTIHVAGNYVVTREPMPVPVELALDKSNINEWMERHNKVMTLIGQGERIYHDKPHAGESFNEPTPGDAADRLEELHGYGYYIPKGLIETLRAEHEDWEAQGE